jgi:hypothetical protein
MSSIRDERQPQLARQKQREVAPVARLGGEDGVERRLRHLHHQRLGLGHPVVGARLSVAAASGRRTAACKSLLQLVGQPGEPSARAQQFAVVARTSAAHTRSFRSFSRMCQAADTLPGGERSS